MKYYVPNSSILFAGNGVVKISSVACGFSPVKIDYSDYPKSFISRINEDYFFSIKYRYSIFFYEVYCGMLQPFVSLQSNLLLCWHGFCDVNVTLSKSMKSRPSMYGRGCFHGIGRCACRFANYPVGKELMS